MAESIHKYYCGYCRQFVFAATLFGLAYAVNKHNTLMHPMDYAGWTPSGIEASSQYSSIAGALPQYVRPYGTTTSKSEWGDAQNAPVITDYDRNLLALVLVKW